MKYRAEIDGLRAIAVIAVILFHSGIGLFKGGYVGVDIFFVISGYLITSIILNDLKENKFSYSSFYERRARRILPALFTVLIVSISLGWFWLLPKDMEALSQSVGSLALFVSNIFFWKTTSYFDAATELKPLIHTWSLSVEEQFYLLFPIVLIIVWNTWLKRHLTLLIVIAVVMSLIFSEYCALTHTAFNFYLLPTRAWELLLGALVGIYLSENSNQSYKKNIAESGAFIGVSLILSSILFFNSTIPFPSTYALIPTIGAALFIIFSANTYVGKIFSLKPLVLIGFISYSAYLWHQPIFAFIKYRGLDEINTFNNCLLICVILILAYLTWRFIEQPFRNNSISARAIKLYGILGSVLFLSIGVIGHFTEGYYFSNARKILFGDIEHGFGINRGLSNECDITFNDSEKCKTNNKPEVIVWGDSYAMHLVNGIVASKPDVKLIQATVSVCGPFFDVAPFSMPDYGKAWGRQCIDSNNRVREYLRSTKSIKYAVLSSPFSQFVNNDAKIQNEKGEIVSGKDYAIESFNKTLNEIKSLGITPVIFSPTPSNGKNIGACLIKARLYGYSKKQCNFKLDDYYENNRSVISFLNAVSVNAKVIWLRDMLCASKECNFTEGDIVLYSDSGHLTKSGSRFLGQRFDFYNLIISANK